MYEMKKQLLV